MKTVGFILLAVAALFQQCNRPPAASSCYKGRLEIKGLCANYTITVLEGKLDTSRIESSWTDESTGKNYQNVFALGSPCSFPDSIREGQEFYFTLAEKDDQCAVCLAYYPKPAKELAIRVLDKPCP
ncbi:MAG TPA: hypothetical protein VGN63_22495 [Flavisolibacter sp.]|jgi:hypothetical protein|nr:hypothetical protein [Flavisolibacter sp.]